MDNDTLLALCAKFIGSHYVDLEQKLIRVLTHYVLPESAVEQILFHLPLNRFVDLEKDSQLSHLSQIFDNFWNKLCEQCSKKSCSFKTRVNNARKSKPGTSDSTKQILLNALFQEIMDTCLHDFVSNDNDLSYMHRAKRAKRAKPSFLLQEAIEGNTADIPNDRYMALLSNQVTNFSVYFRHIDMLIEMMTASDLFSNNLRKVTLKLRNPAKSCIRCSKWCALLRMILERDFICCIEICNQMNNCETIHLLTLCSDGYERELSNSYCSCSRNYAVSINDNTNHHEETPKENCDEQLSSISSSVPDQFFTRRSFITIVSFEFNSLSDTECCKELCHVLESWYGLESLKVSFSKQLWLACHKNERFIVEDNFTKGIWQLCKSRHSHLRCLVILNGVWEIENLITIGSALNTSDVQQKSFTLEDSVVHGSSSLFEKKLSNNSSIDTVTAEKIYFANNDSVTAALSTFSACFNPTNLTVTSSEASSSDLGPLLSHIVDLSKRSYFPGRLVSITTEIESHFHISNIKDIFKNLGLPEQVSILIYHNYEQTTINRIKKLNPSNISFSDRLKTGIDVSSIDDYVSQM